jgi:peptide deformylase
MSDSPKIYLQGDDILSKVCEEVSVDDILTSATVKDAVQIAHRALSDFRKRVGFGRAIAAPQVGYALRFVALSLQDRGAFTMFNPRITSRSDSTFTMWDDCLSFPDLMVCVRRHKRISVSYTDEQGVQKEWLDCTQDISELLQHELDHLDGVLAVDIAVPPARNPDCPKVVTRAAWLAEKDLFATYVDEYNCS